jgi:hypothetical protein
MYSIAGRQLIVINKKVAPKVNQIYAIGFNLVEKGCFGGEGRKNKTPGQLRMFLTPCRFRRRLVCFSLKGLTLGTKMAAINAVSAKNSFRARAVASAVPFSADRRVLRKRTCA